MKYLLCIIALLMALLVIEVGVLVFDSNLGLVYARRSMQFTEAMISDFSSFRHRDMRKCFVGRCPECGNSVEIKLGVKRSSNR